MDIVRVGACQTPEIISDPSAALDIILQIAKEAESKKVDLVMWCKNIKLAGPGAYARTIPCEVLRKIMNDPDQRADFLDFCHVYDSNPYVCGMGKDNLFVSGDVLAE